MDTSVSMMPGGCGDSASTGGAPASNSNLESGANEARWRVALDCAGDGVWDWDKSTGRVYYSPRWKSMLGYTDDEIGDSLEEWSSRVHPEDLPRCQSELERHFRGEIDYYETEHRMQCRDGAYRWVLDRGRVVQRAADGSPLRVIGTHADITPRKQAEAALQERERKINSIFRAAPVGIGLVSNRILQEVNDLLCQMTGYAREELIGQSARMLYLTDEDYNYVGTEKYRQISLYGAGTVETRWRKKNGEIIDVLLSSTPLDPANLPGGVTFTALDITSRKRAEEQARILADLSEISPLSITVHDAEGRYLYANQKTLDLHGYTRDEFNHLTLRDLDMPASARLIESRMKAILQNGEASFEVVHRRKDGVSFPMEVFVKTTQWQGREVFLSVAADISERKASEASLRQSREQYRALVENHSDVIMRFDRGHRYLFVNSAIACMTKLSPEDFVGKTNSQLGFPEDLCRLWEERIEQVFASVAAQEVEFEMRWQDEPQYFNWRLFPELGQAGEVDTVLGVCRDITGRRKARLERARLEQQIQQTQKLESLGVLAGGIAHDFNNLLMAILGHAELALGDISPMSAARESLREILTASRRAADLCRQMLAYSGRASFVSERVNLRDLIEEMAHLLHTSISKKAYLRLQFDEHLPVILADPSQIRQVVMNLLINASEAIGDRDGVITVRAVAVRLTDADRRAMALPDNIVPGQYACLEVADTGCGMDEATRSRIFEPFFTTKFTGRGLGLAAVMGIIKAHKGALQVSSEIGRGTVFKILFPAEKEGAIEDGGGAVVQSAEKEGQGTVLLVDDEAALRALGAKMLGRLGYTVLTAADGREAIEIFRNSFQLIDAVILDMTMPKMDGVEALRELREIDPGVFVILASGYSQEDISQRFAGQDLSGILQKPYTLDNLRQSLAALV